MLIGGIGVGAATYFSASQVSFTPTNSDWNVTNMQEATDSLYTDLKTGKELLAITITDKGVTTSSTDSFSTMASNINLIGTSKVEPINIKGVYGGSFYGSSNPYIVALNKNYTKLTGSIPFRSGGYNQIFLLKDSGITDISKVSLTYYGNGTERRITGTNSGKLTTIVSTTSGTDYQNLISNGVDVTDAEFLIFGHSAYTNATTFSLHLE